MKTILPAALAVFFFAAPALADTPKLARHVCPDGLEILVAEKHETPLVTIEIAVHNGSMTEPPEYNGLSHLYEHMFFKGNKALPDQTAYVTRARELGMIWNGTTNTERVDYFFTTTSDHFADAMVFMRDAITSPLFDAKELDRERVVVTGEIDRNESTPRYYFWHETQKHVFAKYPSRKDPLGTRKAVLAATPAMMRTIQQRYYVPNNSVLMVVGDVKAEDVFQKADAIYEGWKRAPDPFSKFPLVHHPPIARSEVVLVEQPVQTYVGGFTRIGPQTSDASVGFIYAADLLSTIVDDPGSRFQRALVDSGKCVWAWMGNDLQRNASEIFVQFESVDDKVDECTQAVMAEVSKLASPGYYSDVEMRNAAHRAEVDLATSREKTDDYAHLVTSLWATASLDYYYGYVDRLKKVTREDVAKYVETYVLQKPFVFSAMVSPKLASSGMNKAHFESLVGVKGGAK
jgi:zinc protease